LLTQDVAVQMNTMWRLLVIGVTGCVPWPGE